MSKYRSLLEEVRAIRKLANDKFREKLMTLLLSSDMSFIKQGIELNEQLGILTEDELVSLLYKDTPYWKDNDINWFLLLKYPNASHWKTVTYLAIYGSEMAELPKELTMLTNLKVLELHRNKFTSLPKEIGLWTNMEHFTLTESKITQVPSEIGNWKKCYYLYLGESKLTSLPSSIGTLTNLKKLFLQENKLTVLPSWIGNLTNLEVLSLYKNKLTSLPSSIGKLTNLKELKLQKNKLTLNDVPSNLHKITKI